jgi:alkyl hydroperoxide reductase subunit AhpF
VALTLTLLDSGVPERIRTIIEQHRPALPAVIINGKVTPIGRIALERIVKEIEKSL